MNIGDIVQLKSGGPLMTVHEDLKGELVCLWFPTNKHNTLKLTFDSRALRLVEDNHNMIELRQIQGDDGEWTWYAINGSSHLDDEHAMVCFGETPVDAIRGWWDMYGPGGWGLKSSYELDEETGEPLEDSEGNLVPKKENSSLDVHNQLFDMTVGKLCTITDSYQEVYGGEPAIRMFHGDEYSVPMSTSHRAVLTVGYPINKFEYETSDEKEAFTKDLENIQNLIVERIFNPLNDLEYVDEYVDYKNIPLYAFLNGDDKPIPIAPDGTGFKSPHTHYSFSKEWNETDIRNAISNVVEHGIVGNLEIYINSENEVDITAMKESGSFHEFRKPSNEETSVNNKYLKVNLEDRGIGYFDACEVWIKPWVPKDHVVVVDTGAGNYRPFALRYIDTVGHGLKKVGNKYIRFAGVGVKQRHMIAVHQFNQEVAYTYYGNNSEDKIDIEDQMILKANSLGSVGNLQ